MTAAKVSEAFRMNMNLIFQCTMMIQPSFPDLLPSLLDDYPPRNLVEEERHDMFLEKCPLPPKAHIVRKP